MFNSSFAREMTDYLELRTAVLSASSASNDRRVLLLLDQYLVLSGFQGKELTEDILSAWSKTLSGKSKTVKEKLAVVRGFGKYLNTLGHHTSIQTTQIYLDISQQTVDRSMEKWNEKWFSKNNPDETALPQEEESIPAFLK